MSLLTVVVGFKGKIRASDPVPVYTGKDDEAAQKAIDASDCTLFVIHRNLQSAKTITKEPPAPKSKKPAPPAK